MRFTKGEEAGRQKLKARREGKGEKLRRRAVLTKSEI